MDDVTKTVPAEPKKRVRGPRRGKTSIEVAAMVHAESSRGWTEADYGLFNRMLAALRGGL